MVGEGFRCSFSMEDVHRVLWLPV